MGNALMKKEDKYRRLFFSLLRKSKKQQEEIERLTEENHKLSNEWDSTSKYARRLSNENDKLTDELRLYKDAHESIKRNAAELQKQVEELKVYLASEKVCSKQAVKNTAKGILTLIKNGVEINSMIDGDAKIAIMNELRWAGQRYGVEVE